MAELKRINELISECQQPNNRVRFKHLIALGILGCVHSEYRDAVS